MSRVGRRIVSKRPDRDDDEGDNDMQDITQEYKNVEGSHDQRLSVFNAVRGVSRAQQYYDYPDSMHEDVFFDLVDIEFVPFGQSFDVIINIHVRIYLFIFLEIQKYHQNFVNFMLVDFFYATRICG